MTKEKSKNNTPFDKFIDDQIKREEQNKVRQKKIVDQGETPQQVYNKLYRERPGNRTVWRKK
tara:strand:+ start:316 stop:501 length:186 start_codon:yes stop_codon:yes gene_type:complete